MRLDAILVEKKFFETRSKAQDAIQKGLVQVNGKTIQKNSYSVNEDMVIQVEQEEVVFASRAGYKLYDVLEPFDISLKHRTVIDVGASTGGFSDVCLKEGADYVYAVDVGKDQLLPRLKDDERVCCMEGVNCRYLTKEMFNRPIDFACMDVSFISIKLILPALFSIMSKKELVVLIKPQFEAGKKNIGKNGVVKDEKIHIQVLKDMVSFVEDSGLYVKHLCASSILGRDGNKEFVMHIVDTPCHSVFSYKEIVKDYVVKR